MHNNKHILDFLKRGLWTLLLTWKAVGSGNKMLSHLSFLIPCFSQIKIGFYYLVPYFLNKE